ncbi:MAG: hypothetical protein ACE5LC_08270 [Candidatus Aminicenantales bacterium]
MKKKILILALLLSVVVRVHSADIISLEGYLKNFFILFMPPDYSQGSLTLKNVDIGAVNNRLRLKLGFRPSNWLSFYLDYDLSPRIQDPALFRENAIFGGFTPLEYRFNDFKARLYPGEHEPVSSFGLFHNLDRFFVSITLPFADVYLGRQAVAWGSARVINPTDVISPFAFNELDREERRGVDAIRVRIPLGMMDELDVGFVAGRDFRWDKNALFLRGKFYVLKTDISFLFIDFRRHLLLGFDLARSIGDAGFWLEAGYVIPEFFKEDKNPDEENYFRLSVGMDYNLTSRMYGFVEYHFNSAGEKKPELYLSLFTTSPYRDGSVYLMGKNYLNAAATYQVTGLISATALFIINLSDRSLIFSPLLEYNIAENIYLGAGAYIGTGKNPELIPGPWDPGLKLKSEFGTYHDIFFTSFRIYF